MPLDPNFLEVLNCVGGFVSSSTLRSKQLLFVSSLVYTFVMRFSSLKVGGLFALGTVEALSLDVNNPGI